MDEAESCMNDLVSVYQQYQDKPVFRSREAVETENPTLVPHY